MLTSPGAIGMCAFSASALTSCLAFGDSSPKEIWPPGMVELDLKFFAICRSPSVGEGVSAGGVGAGGSTPMGSIATGTTADCSASGFGCCSWCSVACSTLGAASTPVCAAWIGRLALGCGMVGSPRAARAVRTGAAAGRGPATSARGPAAVLAGSPARVSLGLDVFGDAEALVVVLEVELVDVVDEVDVDVLVLVAVAVDALGAVVFGEAVFVVVVLLVFVDAWPLVFVSIDAVVFADGEPSFSGAPA
ncbi:hypothetical protein ABZ319_10660 [Nocardia sp. NPDC005978]|uniref:hypothetical protein n=1 Tax=Nocardia sp. NPDC005978 TaxID=3156725 RepID=UPI00339EF3FC